MTIENTRPVRLEVNCSTGEQTYIELTDEEIARNEAESAAWELAEATKQAEAEAKAAAKASAEAKLSALGLTPEEIAALR
jgi:hypothetical protein